MTPTQKTFWWTLLILATAGLLCAGGSTNRTPKMDMKGEIVFVNYLGRGTNVSFILASEFVYTNSTDGLRILPEMLNDVVITNAAHPDMDVNFAAYGFCSLTDFTDRDLKPFNDMVGVFVPTYK